MVTAFRTRANGATPVEVAAREQALVAEGTTPCGRVCDDGCHGELVCVRAMHAHDPDADMGLHPVTQRPRPKGNLIPHLALLPDGSCVQWTCLPADHDGLTAVERTAKRQADRAAARAAATRVLLAQIDPALLVSLLREGGHLDR
jgi:hypothetical protein